MGNRRFDYLSDFFRAGPAIWLRCRECGHKGEVVVAELVKRYALNTPTRALLRLFVCAGCGCRDFDWFPRSRDG